MNPRETLLHAYDSLARRCHQWPAAARALAMAEIWKCYLEVKQEETMPGKPWPHAVATDPHRAPGAKGPAA